MNKGSVTFGKTNGSTVTVKNIYLINGVEHWVVDGRFVKCDYDNPDNVWERHDRQVEHDGQILKREG